MIRKYLGNLVGFIIRMVGSAFFQANQKNAAVEVFRMAVENEPDNLNLRMLFTKSLDHDLATTGDLAF